MKISLRPAIRYLATGESKEKNMNMWRTRGGSLGGPLTLAGDLEEAGVPQSLDGKWMKDAKSKN